MLTGDSARRAQTLAVGVMALATVGAVLLIGFGGQGQVLKGDEWGYAARLASEGTLDAILEPPAGKYLIVVPLLVYEGLLETAGADDYLAFRLVGLLLTVSIAWLVFEFARRRVGALAALAAGLLLLYFGAATEVVGQPLRLPSQFAVAAGIGAWVALERDGLGGRVAACVLTTVAVTSHPVGLAFLAGTAVLVAWPAPSRGPRDWWVFAIPALVFASWWALGRVADEGAGGSVADALPFAAESLAAAAAAVTGVFRDPVTGTVDLLSVASWLALLTLLMVTGIAALRRGVSRYEVAIAVALAISLIAPVFASGQARSPDSFRYLYPNAILLLLLLAESFRGERQRAGPALAAFAAVACFALFSNVATLADQVGKLADRSTVVRAQLAALELARGAVRPDFRTEGVQGSPRGGFAAPAGPYLRVSDAYGTPAYSEAELAGRDPRVRAVADAVLVSALGLELAEAPPGVPCDPLALGSGPSVALDPGSYLVRAAGREPARIALGRFADGTPVALGRVSAGETAELTIPRDGADAAWRMSTEGVASVCGLP